MARTYHESDFPDHDYDEFYESHFFQPVSEEDAVNAHRIMPRVAWALDIAKQTRPANILDLGCLDGYAVLTLVNHLKARKANGWGVDLSEDGIRLAQERAKIHKLPVIFKKDSIENFLQTMAEDGIKFDLVMMFEVIEHVEDPSEILELIDKVKTRDGTVLISTPAFESPTYGKDDEQNKCHVRLYTARDEDYEEKNKYGTLRKATSIFKEIGYGNAKRGHERVQSCDTWSELLHVRYT